MSTEQNVETVKTKAAPFGAEGDPAKLIDRSVIHDLRNPLSAIAGNLQLLQSSLEATIDARNKTRLDNCLASVDELTGMLADLQYLVLMQAGDLEPSFKVADTRALVRTVLMPLVPKARKEEKSINLVEGASPCLPMMSQLVARAVQNLIVSALRASKSEPVDIQIDDEPNVRVRYSVTYKGVRVPPPLSDHLFDIDFIDTQNQHGMRVDRSRGLYFVRATAELHGGRVAYEPRDDGGQFVLELPYQPYCKIAA